MIPQRTAVRDAILRMNHFPVGMEQFGAADEEQWEIIKQTINTSDYYVLIIGYRYGSVIPAGHKDAGISYTEKEFRYAEKSSVPILAFFPDESVPISPNQLEDEESRKKLEAFKSSIKSSKLVDFWKNEDDLATKVIAALYKQFDRTQRPGWVRGGDNEEVLQTIVNLHGQLKKLEDENRILKSHGLVRKPKLMISISCKETLEAAEDKFEDWYNSENRETPLYEETEEGLTIFMKHIPHSGFSENTDELCMDDVPKHLKSLVNEMQLKEYNEQLPDKDEVEKYNFLMHRFKTVKENGVVLGISISNDGNVKATDIHVEIVFPESFTVIEKADAIDLTAPKMPKFPDDPIEKAQREYDRKYSGLMNSFNSPLAQAMSNIGSIASFTAMPLRSAVLAESIHAITHWSVSADNHSVHVWRDSLLHTYEWNKGTFVVAPTKAGEFTVKITAICEELTEPVEYEYKIKVVDIGY